jgi:hypothetical protein
LKKKGAKTTFKTSSVVFVTMCDSKIHEVCPTDELVDIIDAEWLGEQISDDAVDIDGLLRMSQTREQSEDIAHLLGDKQQKHNYQDNLLFMDHDDEEWNSNNGAILNGEEASDIGPFGDDVLPQVEDKDTRQWNELDLDFFHQAYE